MPNTFLHMLYAGRGDAFIIEEEASGPTESSRFYILDGGPLDRWFNGPPGPFYQYLKAAIARISLGIRPDHPVAPDAIFISHWHADHYGGLKLLFERYLARKWSDKPVDDRFPLVFNGPLVAPVAVEEPGRQVEQEIITGFGFEAIRDPLLDNFRFGDGSVLQALARRPLTRMAREWSEDPSKENRSSLLLAHVSGIVATGDNVASLIAPFLRAMAGGDQPVVRLFKVPHHGSLRNSQTVFNAPEISAVAVADYALYFVLSYGLPDLPEVPDPVLLQHDGFWQAANGLLLALLREEQVDPQTLRSEIGARMGEAVAAIGHGETRWDPQLTGTQARTDRIWAALRQAIEQNPHQLFYADNSVTALQKRQPKPPQRFGDFSESLDPQSFLMRHDTEKLQPYLWTERFLAEDNLRAYYLRRIATRGIAEFYAGFTAEAYVISAHGEYGHPGVETLAGLVLAARVQKKRAVLYVTDGESVDLTGLRELVGDPWSQDLSIRYLAGSTIAALDLAQAGAEMDIAKVTRELTDGGVDRPGLHRLLEAGPGTLPDLGHLPEYEIAAGGSYLSIAQGAPTVVAQATPCIVQDWWGDPRIGFGDVRIVDPHGGTSCCVALVPHTDQQGQTGYALALYALSVDGVTVAGYVAATRDDKGRYLTDTLADAPAFSFAPKQAFTLAVPARKSIALVGAPASRSFQAFCADMRLATTPPPASAAALAAMIGPEALAGLQTQIGASLDQQFLSWPVDLGAGSTVAYDKGPPLAVRAASLMLTPPSDAKIEIAGRDVPVTGASLALQWGKTLDVSLRWRLAEGFTLSHDGKLMAARYSMSVPDYLMAMGVSAADAAVMPVGKVLAVMLGQGPAEQALRNLPPTLLRGKSAGTTTPTEAPGLLSATINPASAVEVVAGAPGRLEVSQAVLRLRPPSANLMLSLDGLAFTLSDLVLTVTDARLVRQRVTLRATATFPQGNTFNAGIDLSAAQGDLHLWLPEGKSLSELCAVLPGTPEFDGLTVPGAPKGEGISSLLAPAPGPGIRLEPASTGSGTYGIAAVYVNAKFNGWTGLLPSALKPPADTAILLQVLHPTSKTPQVALSAAFLLSANGKPLALTFAADPLPNAGEYLYQIDLIGDAAKPANLTEVLGALALSDAVGSAIAALPLVGDVLRHAWLEEGSLTVEGGAITDFTLSLLSDSQVTLVGNLLTLRSARFELDRSNQTWRVNATAKLDLAGNTFTIDALLPRRETPGSLAFANPSGLTIGGFLKAVGLPDLAGTPVIGDLQDIAIIEAELRVAYLPAGDPKAAVSVAGGRVLAALAPRSLGPLVLAGVSLEVSHTVAAAASGFSPAGTSFSMEARLGTTGKVIASLQYRAGTQVITGSLNAVSATLGDALAQVLPRGALLDAISGLVGGLALKSGTVALNISDGQALQSFTLLAAADESLPVAALSITKLAVAYGWDNELKAFKTTLAGSVALDLDALSPDQSYFRGLKYLLDWKTGSPLRLSASAVIAPKLAIADKARFLAQLPAEMTLLSAVHLDGLSITYQPVMTPKLTIDVATAWVTIPTSSNSYTPNFSGRIVLGKVPKEKGNDKSEQVDGATASLEKKVEKTDPQDGSDFLGIPRLKLRDLQLKMEWAFDLWHSLSLDAQVSITDKLTLTAHVLFENDTASEIVLVLGGGVGFGALLGTCLGAADWGASLPDLSLRDGTLSYRAARGKDPKQFAASCFITLLGQDFRVTGTLIDGVGSEIGGELTEPLKMVVFKVTGRKDPKVGPRLAVVSKAGTAGKDKDKVRQLTFDFGLDVFDQPFPDGQLSYTPPRNGNPALYGGSLHYKDKLPLLGKVDWTLSAVWDETNGFRITDWPFDSDLIEKLVQGLRMMEQFENLVNSVRGSCPEIKLDTILKGKFKAGLALVSKPGEAPAVRARVSYALSIQNPFTQQWHWLYEAIIDSDPEPFNVPKDFPGFLAELARIIAMLVPNMIAAAAKDAATLGRIAAIYAAQKAGQAALDQLLCRDPPATDPPPGGQDPSPPGGPGFGPPGGPIPPPPIGPGGGDDDKKGGGGGAAGGPELAAMLLARAKELLAQGKADRALAEATTDLSLATVLATQAASQFGDAGKKADAVRTAAEARTALAGRYAVSGLSLRYEGNRRVTLTWNEPPAPPSTATVSYNAVLQSEQRLPVPARATSVTITDPSFVDNATVTVSLRVDVLVQTDKAFLPLNAVTPVQARLVPPVWPSPNPVFFGQASGSSFAISVSIKGKTVATGFSGFPGVIAAPMLAADRQNGWLYVGYRPRGLIRYNLRTNDDGVLDSHQEVLLTPQGGTSAEMSGLTADGSSVYWAEQYAVYAFDLASRQVRTLDAPGLVRSYAVDRATGYIWCLVPHIDVPGLTLYGRRLSERQLAPLTGIPQEFAPLSVMRFDAEENAFYWMTATGIVKLAKPSIVPRLIVPAKAGWYTGYTGAMPVPLDYVPGTPGRLYWHDDGRKAILSALTTGADLQVVTAATAPCSLALGLP